MSNIFYLSIICLFILLIQPAQSADRVIYKQSFTTNPYWSTNNPSNDYWDANTSSYYFNIEPGTGNVAYPYVVNYTGGSFLLEYSVILNNVDVGSTFRLGFAGNDVDRMIGPNIITEFTNDYKYGNIMRLHIITDDARLYEVSSNRESYGGSTIRFDFNKWYHVAVTYNDDTYDVIMKVMDRDNNKLLWTYYIPLHKPISGMKRIYIGSVGDYTLNQNIYATGNIDDVYLYSVIKPIPTVVKTITPIPTNTPYIATPLPTHTITLITTPVPTTQSPSLFITPIIGVGLCGILWKLRK